MHVQFWGTRGSIPKPGPSTARYGGNTPCIEVRSERGTLVVIDCGTGIHALGQKLMSSGGGKRGHILISHTHWDHIQGFPFFAPLFVPGNAWDVYGPKGLGQSLRETLTGQMEHSYFPVTAEQFNATVRYHDLLEGSFDIEDIRVSTHYLNHPALTLAYRLEADGASVVYCCDHEPYSRTLATGENELVGQDLHHAAFVQGADLLIHDAQYTAAEYPAKVGWGHSPVEYVVKLGQQAGVKKIALIHHDPLRDDNAIDRILEGIKARPHAAQSQQEIFAAAEGTAVKIVSSQTLVSERGGQFHATTTLQPALNEPSILLSIADPSMAVALSEATHAEGIRANLATGIDEALKLLAKDRPSLAMLEHDGARIDGLQMCRALRQKEGAELPVIMVAAREDLAAGTAAGVTEWLISPFSPSYARTKIRAWVLRTACRWVRATIPQDEQQRIASLRSLNILDTAPEERFDRVTRLAAALFDIPIARISLVDEQRQWFKSCVGLNSRETSRDEAMCAHVVHSREPLIVSDTFLDERFADNPMVINEPRIRFYAGYPLILDDKSCIGTLCLLDTRPRTLTGHDLERLRDLADIALRELQESPQLGPPALSGNGAGTSSSLRR